MVTGTLDETDSAIEDGDNAELIEQLLKAREPGDFMDERVIHAGDEEEPAPILAGSLTSAGYVKVYNTKTGDCSTISRNMLPVQMAKIHPDGTRAFSRRPPAGVKPVVGTIKCMLHADSPERAEYEAMGFPTCPMDNIRSNFALENHMKHRHRLEWAVISEQRERRAKDEERAFQRQMMKTMAAATAGNKRERKAKAS